MTQHNFFKNLSKGLLTALVGTVSLTAQAQFTSSGGNTTTNDNVGIGLTSPTAKLHIVSGYTTSGGGVSCFGCPPPAPCTYTGQPALSIFWNDPNNSMYATSGCTNGPDIMQVYGQTTSYTGTTVSTVTLPYFWMNSGGKTGIGMYPKTGKQLSVNGYTYLSGNTQVTTALRINNNTSLTPGDWAPYIFPYTFSVDNGDANFNGNTYIGGDVQSHPNLIQRVTVGPAWGGGGLYGMGYVGFNWARDQISGNNWTYVNDGASNGAAVIYANAGGDLNFSSRPNTGPSSGTTSDADIVNNIKMSIRSDGSVKIGTKNPVTSTYTPWRLSVDGNIVCRKVFVETTDWADYVFAADYKLQPLPELEAYILANKHLPNVPSEQTVKEQGVDVGEMNKLLLQKVEELTLRVIELNKKIEALKHQ